MIMYFADCPRCGKPDSSANGFDLCEECQEAKEKESQLLQDPWMQTQEVKDDDHS